MFIKAFRELGKNDAGEAGGKGASLGEMTQAGIPVPPGFVVLSEAFEHFLSETDLSVEIDTILHTVSTDKMHTVEHASEQVQKMILEAKMPETIASDIQKHFQELGAVYVAVRSSATAEDSASAAWAGQLDTFLNTTEATLLQNVQKCWASLFTPRAIFYRFEQGLHASKISVAVVVQEMVASKVSGIAFSVHPVTEDRNQLIIEAGYGLGEAIVSGQITPDSYVVEKSPRRILDRNIAKQERGIFRKAEAGNEWREIESSKLDQQKLTDEQILELSEIIVTIENHYCFPCDIEWALEKGKFYIVQSRPITTLGAIEVESSLTVPLFKQHTAWSKNWDSEFSLLAADIGLNVYKLFPKMFDAPLSPVIAHVRGVTSCYYADEELDAFTKQLWSIYEKRPLVLDEWISVAEKACDRLAGLMKNPQATLTQFTQCVDEFGAPNFAIREITNPLDASRNDRDKKKVIRYRKYTELFYYHMDIFLKRIIDSVASTSGYDTELIQSLTLPELSRYLDEHISLPESTLLRERYLQSVAWYKDGLLTYYEGDKDEALSLLRGIYDGSGVFSGVKAYGGKTRGKVKKITAYDATVTITSDDILVTGMTDPRFIHLMHTAKAFVTDAGGMLSHAAIVARELKKPCLVGTKIATQVLHDGDLVEVDADNGVVRILEKSGISVLESLNPNDYTFYFRTKGGFPLLFPSLWYSSIVAKRPHYRTVVMNGSDLAEYDHLSAIIENEKVGLATHQNIQKTEQLYAELQDVSHSLDSYKRKKEFSRDDVREIFILLGRFFEHYNLFGPHYTDAVFAKYPEDSEIIVLIGNCKNNARLDFNRHVFEENSVFYRACEMLAYKLNRTKEDVLVMTADELWAYLDKEIIPDICAADRQSYVILVEGGVCQYFYDADLVQTVEKKFNTYDSEAVDQDGLRGVSVAKKGVIQGHVKNIDTDFTQFSAELEKKSGQNFADMILVADTTGPELVPLMKTALAIITNVGGMLSHAAIISRELNIPCIVGTKIATQVLKDSDLVEVDADNGVVRIVEKTEEKGIDFKKRKWVVYGASGWPAYMTPFGVVPSRKFSEMYGLTTEGIGLWKGSNFDWLFDEAELNAFAIKLLPKLLHQPWGQYDDWQVQVEKFNCLHGELMDVDLTESADEELQEWTKKYYEAFMAQYVTNNFIEPLSFYFQHHLRDLLVRAGAEDSQAKMLIEKYGTSSKTNYVKQCIEEYKKTKNADEISALLKKFHYLKNDYTGSHKMTKHDLDELAVQKNHEVKPAVQDEVLPKRAKDLLMVLQMTATLQDVRKAQSLMWISGAEKIVRELAGRVAIPVEELLFATWEEIMTQNFDREELKRRQEGCVIHWQTGKTDIYSGAQATQMMMNFKKTLIGEEAERIEIRGISASGGRITGRVVVVSDVSQFDKVKEGDVLVAMMTRPEYLPVMRLASSFVTDEGGITSHAAIVAREMKKPCIIGTKIATQVLKDSDLVEVDADNGVVRIVEKTIN